MRYHVVMSLAAPCLLLMALAVQCGCSQGQGPLQSGFSAERVAGRRQGLGRELYARYCVHCHGASGAGDGLNAYNLPVNPPDFSSRKWQESRTDSAIEAFIRLGGRRSGRSALCPEWGRTLSQERVFYLRCYLRSLTSSENRKIEGHEAMGMRGTIVIEQPVRGQ